MIKKSELRKAISLRLKAIRESLSFNQEKMSIHFGLSRTSYTRNEKGDTFPNHLALYKLAVTFDVSLDWLICGKGPMFFKEKSAGTEKIGTRQGAPVGPVSTGHRELLEQMEKTPLLYHEVMAFFYRFLLDNKELVETTMKKDTPGQGVKS